MIIQITNAVSGFVLSASKLKEVVGGRGAEHIATAETKINAFRGTLGVVELVLGAVALIERIIGQGGSFPQSVAALACGALLVPHLFEKYPSVKAFVGRMRPYEIWIGVAALLIGIGSILFGCISPVCYSF